MRILLRGLAALCLVVAIGIGVLILLPGQKLAQIAADQLEEKIGRSVSFDGEVRFSLWPTLGLRANDVSIANAPWAGPEPLLSAGRLNIGLDAADLLTGKIRITELTAIVPQLNLQTRADGTGNWEFTPPSAETTGAGSPEAGDHTDITIETISVAGGAFTYTPFAGDTVEMQQVDMSLGWSDPSAPANLAVTLRPAGTPVQISAQIDALSEVLSGRPSHMRVMAQIADSEVSFDGRADLSGQVSGHIIGRLAETDAVLQGLGLEALELPEGLGHRGEFAAEVVYGPDGTLVLDNLALDLEGNQISGTATLGLMQTPVYVSADLSTSVLDLNAAQDGGASGSQAVSAKDTAAWSQDVIDASVLGMLDAEVMLTVAGVNMGDVLLGQSDVTVTVDQSRAVMSLQPVTGFGGQIAGQLVVNNRSGMSVAADLSFEDIQLQRLLGQTASYNKLEGLAAGNIKLLGTGNTLSAIVNSLSGTGGIEVGAGRFTGFDLHVLMDPDNGDGGTTIFDALSASYVIENGVLTTEDFVASLPVLTATGTGDVGLGQQDMDMLLTPTAFAGDGISGLSVPLRIHGPWSDLSFTPDLTSLEELRALQEQAADALKAKLSEELEAPIESLEEAEDALRQRIEDQAKNQLLKFLGQN